MSETKSIKPGYYWLRMSPELAAIDPFFGFDPVEVDGDGLVYRMGVAPGMPIDDDWEWGERITPGLASSHARLVKALEELMPDCEVSMAMYVKANEVPTFHRATQALAEAKALTGETL